MTRTRSMSLPNVTGTRTRASDGAVVTRAYSPHSATVVDVNTNPGGDNAFDLIRTQRGGGIVNGSVFNTGTTYTYVNFPSSISISAAWPGSFSTPPSGTYRDTNQAIANLHPGEPVVALPVFLFELKDVPDMLKHAAKRAGNLEHALGRRGRNGIESYFRDGKKATAEDWLNYNFGWRPLVSDLVDILNLSEAISKRAKIIRRMKRGEIRRTVALGDWQETTSGTASPFNGQQLFFNDVPNVGATHVRSQKHSKWLSTRWRVSQEMFQAALHPESGALQKAMLGLDLSVTHFYDAMPWSWLVDWFTGLGDIIHAKQNRFGISYRSGCLMHSREVYATVHPTSVPNGLTMTHYWCTQVSKTRTLVAPSLANWGLKVLEPSQLTTLASLAVTRGR